MGRLIDADKLILHLNDWALSVAEIAPGVRPIEYKIVMDCIKAVEQQPTAFDTGKVLEQIGKRIFSAECYNQDFNGTQICNLLCFGDVAEIICDGGVE